MVVARGRLRPGGSVMFKGGEEEGMEVVEDLSCFLLFAVLRFAVIMTARNTQEYTKQSVLF
jgi:hypothetical protein